MVLESFLSNLVPWPVIEAVLGVGAEGAEARPQRDHAVRLRDGVHCRLSESFTFDVRKSLNRWKVIPPHICDHYICGRHMCASSLVAAVAEGSGPEGVVGGEGVVVQVGGAHRRAQELFTFD